MANDGEIEWKSSFESEKSQQESSEAKETEYGSSVRAGGHGRRGYFDVEPAPKQKPTSFLSRRSDLGSLSDVPTPPIDVPLPRSEKYENIMTMVDEPLGGQFEGSLDGYMQRRRPSISFDSQAVLGKAVKGSLEQAMPKLQIKSGARGKSPLEEMRKKASMTVGFDIAQSHSEGLQASMERDASYLRQQPRTSLLQAPVDVAEMSTPSNLMQSQTLTSETTISPVPEELDLSPPISPLFPWRQPNSLAESSAWPRPNQASPTWRAKSFTLGHSSSLRSLRRQQLNRRSAASSMSPASAFLSKWARDESSPAPEPDGEGQEVGDFVLGRQIGSGGFSIVREAYHLVPTTPSSPIPSKRMLHAVKIVRRQVPGAGEDDNDTLQSDFDHEVTLWRCLQHANILQLVAVNFTSFATFAFSTMATGGTLFDLVRQNRRGLRATLARRYAVHLAHALRYLHEDVRIVHRDVKLEKCLIDLSNPESASLGGTLLLCDFGLAAEMRHEQGVSDEEDESDDQDPDGITMHNTHYNAGHPSLPLDYAPPNTATTKVHRTSISSSATSTYMAGSLPYAAPEVVRGPRTSLRPGVDVWALGCVVYACVVGDLPFQHALPGRVRDLILSASWDAATLRSRVRGWPDLESKQWSLSRGSEARRVDAANGLRCRRVEDETKAAVQLIAGCLEVNLAQRWSIGMCLRGHWLAGLTGGSYDDEDKHETAASEVWNAGPRS